MLYKINHERIKHLEHGYYKFLTTVGDRKIQIFPEHVGRDGWAYVSRKTFKSQKKPHHNSFMAHRYYLVADYLEDL